MSGRTKWLSSVVSLLGAWLVVSPFVLVERPASLTGGDWNDVIIGIAIFLVAGYDYYRQTRGLAASVGSASLLVLLGLWTIVAPFVVFGPRAGPLLWSNVVTGVLVALIAAFVAYESREAERVTPGTA